MFIFSSADFFSKSTFTKNSFMNTIRVSNSFDPDQVRLLVGSDLAPNCSQRVSTDDTSRRRANHWLSCWIDWFIKYMIFFCQISTFCMTAWSDDFVGIRLLHCIISVNFFCPNLVAADLPLILVKSFKCFKNCVLLRLTITITGSNFLHSSLVIFWP